MNEQTVSPAERKLIATCRTGGPRWMKIDDPEMRAAAMSAREKGLLMLQIDDKNGDRQVYARLTDKGMTLVATDQAERPDVTRLDHDRRF